MPDDLSLSRRVLKGIVWLTVLRLLWHLIEPIGMVGDETYYWEWGRRPDLGYYSKPPFIGWLYGVLGWASDHSTYAFKAFCTLLAGGSLYALFLGVRAASSVRVAAWTTLLAALSPGNLLSASLLTIDAPLLFFWAWGFAFSALILFSRQPRSIWLWLGLCCAWGLGYLSKQMMMFQPLLFLIAAAACRPQLLKNPKTYLSIGLSFLALTPPMIWNARNDWVTFTHTAHHFESAADPFWQRCGDFFGALAGGVLSPGIALILFIAIYRCLKNPRAMNPAERFYFIYGALGLIGISLLLLRQELNPNWPAVFLLGSFALSTEVWLTRRPASATRWLKSSAWIAGVMSLLVMAYLPLRQELGWQKSQRRLDAGFREGATAVEAVLQSIDEPYDGIIVLGHRFEASQLAFHLPDHPFLYQFPRGPRVKSQYDVWPGPEAGGRFMVIQISTHKPGQPPAPGRPFPDLFGEAFELAKVRPLEKKTLTIPLTKRSRTYEFFLTGPLLKWPQPSDRHE